MNATTDAERINSLVSITPLGFDLADIGWLDSMASTVHAGNVAAGWWTDLQTGESLKGKRNLGELLCLVHSEVSEGFEGFLDEAPDDKLPHRPMFEVELADVLIRVFDIVGGFNLNLGSAALFVKTELLPGNNAYQVYEDIGRLHGAISRAMEGHRKKKQHPDHPELSMLEMGLAEVVVRVFHLARKLNFDLGGAYEEKLAFNAVRLDHKMENRIKEGGKAY